MRIASLEHTNRSVKTFIKPIWWLVPATLFPFTAVVCSIGAVSMHQTNQIYSSCWSQWSFYSHRYSKWTGHPFILRVLPFILMVPRFVLQSYGFNCRLHHANNRVNKSIYSHPSSICSLPYSHFSPLQPVDTLQYPAEGFLYSIGSLRSSVGSLSIVVFTFHIVMGSWNNGISYTLTLITARYASIAG